MFTDHLSPTERLALFDLLVKVASSDGTVGDDERQLLEESSRTLALGDVDLTQHLADAAQLDLDGLKSLVGTFESKAAKAIALSELMHLASIDGVFDKNEREAVKVVASWMSVDEDHLDKIYEWTAEGLEWRAKGREVLGL